VVNQTVNVKFKVMNKEQILGLVRHSLTFIGGIILSKGLIEESTLTEIIGAISTLIGSIWSISVKTK
jgi:hypothetical protein